MSRGHRTQISSTRTTPHRPTPSRLSTARLVAMLRRPAMLLVPVATAALSTSACLPASIRTVSVPVEETFEVQGAPIGQGNPLLPGDILPFDFGALLSNAISQSISTENVKEEAIESLKLTKLTLTVDSPNEGGTQVRSLEFIESLTFHLGAEGKDAIQVAAGDDTHFGNKAVSADLTLSEAELAGLLGAGALDMTADVEANPPVLTTSITLSAELTIVIDPVGAVTP